MKARQVRMKVRTKVKVRGKACMKVRERMKAQERMKAPEHMKKKEVRMKVQVRTKVRNMKGNCKKVRHTWQVEGENTQVVHNHRFRPSFHQLKNKLKEDFIMEIVLITFD